MSCEDSESVDCLESCEDTRENDGNNDRRDTVNMCSEVVPRNRRKGEKKEKIDPYKVYEHLQLSLEEVTVRE